MTNNENILLIMGNGFDLNSSLRSRYKDFFDWRSENLERIISNAEIEENTLKDYLSNKLNFNGKLTTQKDIEKHLNDDLLDKISNDQDKIYLSKNKITGWDCFFQLAKEYLSVYNAEWQDIEQMISNVVNLLFETFDWPYYFDNKKEFTKKVKQCFGFSASENPKIASTRILDDLNKFENVFAHYLSDEVNNNELYKICAREIIKQLALEDNVADIQINVDIFSFNYSLNEKQKEKYNQYLKKYNVKINSWYNIHGIVNNNTTNSNIIFGIDITDILDNKFSSNLLNDPRIKFTKSFRIISEHVNKLRDAVFNSDIDKIIIYGHSLNKMDYSYFRTIFEILSLYRSNKVVLELHYYPDGDSHTDHTEEKNNIERLVDLLVTYSKTLGEQYENSIIDRLILQDRLSVIPMNKDICKNVEKKIRNEFSTMFYNNKDKLVLPQEYDISDRDKKDTNSFITKARKYMEYYVSTEEKSETGNPEKKEKTQKLLDYMNVD